MKQLSSYLKPRGRYVPQLYLLAAAFCALALWLFAQTWHHYGVAVRATRQGDQLRAALATKPAPKPNRAALEEQKKWTALRQERDFAWAPLFLAVERSGSPDIELLEFLPDKTSRRVVLRGEARDNKALAGFLDALAGQPALKNVYLAHQEAVARDRLETVAFEIKGAITE